jgi:hypothetical protein
MVAMYNFQPPPMAQVLPCPLRRGVKKRRGFSHVSPRFQARLWTSGAVDWLDSNRDMSYTNQIARWLCPSAVPASLLARRRLAACRSPNARDQYSTGAFTDILFSSVSRWDRLLLFGGLNLAAAAMFIIGIVLVPTGVFLIKPRKFVVL